MIENSHRGEKALAVTKNNEKVLIECLSNPDPHTMMMKKPILQKEKSTSTSILPWIAQDVVNANTLSWSLSLRQTQFALDNFSLDIKFAKSSPVNCFNCPQFPHSEWNQPPCWVCGRPQPCLVGVILHIPGTEIQGKGWTTRNAQIGYCVPHPI